MSKDKYTGIFSRKIQAIVFIILQIFSNTREKIYTNSSGVCCLECFLFIVISYD